MRMEGGEEVGEEGRLDGVHTNELSIIFLIFVYLKPSGFLAYGQAKATTHNTLQHPLQPQPQHCKMQDPKPSCLSDKKAAQKWRTSFLKII